MIQGLGPIKESKPISIGGCLAWVTRDPRWLKAVAIGALWNVAVLLLLPAVVLLGFGARVLKASFLDERATIPRWTPVGPLLLEGLRVLGIMAVHYLIAGAAIWGMSQVFTLPEAPPGDEAGIAFIGGMLAVGGLALLALGFFGLYVLTATSRVVVLDRWTAGFEVVENLDFLRRNANNYGRFVAIVIIVSTLFQFSPGRRDLERSSGPVRCQVIVNGDGVFENGAMTAPRPGRVLFGPAHVEKRDPPSVSLTPACMRPSGIAPSPPPSRGRARPSPSTPARGRPSGSDRRTAACAPCSPSDRAACAGRGTLRCS